jgi:DNA-directed RNA polymerase specialized sigma subunit
MLEEVRKIIKLHDKGILSLPEAEKQIIVCVYFQANRKAAV